MNTIVGFVWFAIALSCLILFWILTHRFRRAPPVPAQEQAFVVCSICGCYLSGLERECPRCRKRLFYAVRSRPESPFPEPPPPRGKGRRRI